ncbi:MAG TPA: hypothetical protein VLE43_04345, partial [Candidatus Saccharimonadia bacterium]|nr:hypothetical protein [Candidatus Saccharimonadia bacterium]
LAAQIRKYQSGIRGVHPKDVNGQKMVFSAGFVEDEEVLKSLVAYLVELQKPSASDAASDPFKAEETWKKPAAPSMSR